MEKEVKTKGLRSGYTTGTTAAAAASAAASALFTGKHVAQVEIVLPPSKRTPGSIIISVKKIIISENSASAVVIKDAGDDPDVTNGAAIGATIRITTPETKDGRTRIRIEGGEGVGRVTKPGLAIRPGQAAINPVPLQMIKNSVRRVLTGLHVSPAITVTINVENGLEISKKTMNARLGIIGGISILGTTGIVEPLSLSAYRDSILCALDVVVAGGLTEAVLSTGRSSEKAVEKFLDLDERAFVLTGDHMGFALKAAGERSAIKSVKVVGQFGKFTKLAAGHFETHCSDSSISLSHLAGIAREAGAGPGIIKKIKEANTAREVFLLFKEKGLDAAIKIVCKRVSKNAKQLLPDGVRVSSVLVDYHGKIEARSK